MPLVTRRSPLVLDVYERALATGLAREPRQPNR